MIKLKQPAANFQMPLTSKLMLLTTLVILAFQFSSAQQADAYSVSQSTSDGTVTFTFRDSETENNNLTVTYENRDPLLSSPTRTVIIKDLNRNSAGSIGSDCAKAFLNASTTICSVSTSKSIKLVFNLESGDDSLLIDPTTVSWEPVVTANGGEGDDTIDTGDRDDTIDGGNGADLLYGGGGSDALNGGGDIDIVDYSKRSQGVYASIDGVANDGVPASGSSTGENDNIGTDVEFLIGSPQNDILIGSSGANNIDGQAGSDYIFGGAGVDFLRGRDGADNLYGEGDDDDIHGGDGDDHLDGGSGIDGFDAGPDDDYIFADDNDDDNTVGCKGGNDHVFIDSYDSSDTGSDCEYITIR